MGRLLRLDLRRALRDKLVIVVFAVTIVLSFLEVLLGTLMKYSYGGFTFYTLTTRSLLLSSMSISSTPFLLIAIMVAVFLGKDLTFGTIRNKIIAGYSKKEIYFTHLIISLILATAALLVYQILVFSVGSMFITPPNDWTAVHFQDFAIRFGLSYLIVWTAVSIVVFIELMTKSLVTALIVSIILFVFGPIIGMGISTYFVFRQALGDSDLGVRITDFFYFYQAYTVPNGSLLDQLGGSSNAIEASLAWKTLGVNLVMLGGLNFLGIYLFPKTDLK
ncbi:MAG: hypothetical protein NTV44_01430 [Firmicutes bacterium]|nr:hypothetical protein [Bacillota bacterium]